MNLDKSHFPSASLYNKSHFDGLYKLLNEITYINCTQQLAELRNYNVRVLKEWFTKYAFNFDNYSAQLASAKLIYTFDMFLGRLEIYPVLIVLSMIFRRQK